MQTICILRGFMRPSFSPFRKEVLDYVEKSDLPVSAEDIRRLMKTDVAFSTVYRALLFLQKEGRVEAIPLSCTESCGKRSFFIAAGSGHRHFFHCEKCHTFLHVPGCAAESMTRTIENELGATVRGHVLYFTGLCCCCRGVQ